MIDNQTNKLIYDGNGSNREFSVTFPVNNFNNELLLFKNTISTEQVEFISQNYSLDKQNSKVIYPTLDSGLPALTSDEQIVILRYTAITQLKDYSVRLFKSVDVEQMVDKLTLICQDLEEKVERAISLPVTATTEDKIAAKELIQEIKNLKQTVAEISGDIPDITEELASKMPLAGGTFTGDVTLNSGVSLKTQNGRIHEVNNKIVIGEKSSDKGLYVSPNGETAALVGNTVKNILTNNDVTSTYSPSGVSPVNGLAVASALSGISGQLPDQTGKAGKFLSTDGTNASWEDIPTFTQEQADWSEADNTKASFIKNKPTIPDVSGKANLAGGNSFTGTQIISNASNTVGIQLFETTNNSHSDITQTSSGLGIVCNSTNAGFKFNDVSLLKNMVNISSFPATLVENKNYYATISGSATFVLPTPTNTSFENTINILLTVSVSSTVDWGVNANSVLSSFTAGKYEIRLRYNNATSNWIGEVLKQEATPSHTKCFVSFNNNYIDQTGNITLTPVSTITYTDGAFPDYNTCGVARNDSFTISGNTSVWNFGTGAFTISCWYKNNYNSYGTIAKNSDNSTYFTTQGIFKVNGTNLNPTDVGSANGWGYYEWTRDNDGVYRFFINGVQQFQNNVPSVNVDLSSLSLLSGMPGMASTTYLNDFVITDQAGHTKNYVDDVPTAPYVISDNSLPDLHDNTKQNALSQTQLNAVNSGIDSTKVAQIATNAYDIGLLQTALQNLSFVEFVVSLPTQDIKTGVIYCVPLNEADLSGKTIVEEFIYNNNQWYAVGAFSTNIDASTLVLKSMFEFDSGTGTLNINLGN